MCDEFCAPFDVDMVKGIHYPSEVPNVTDGMADLKITHDSPQSSDTHKTLNNHTVSLMHLRYTYICRSYRFTSTKYHIII